MGIFHRHFHEWQLIDKTILPSAFQQMMAESHGRTVEKIEGGPVYFQSKVVLTFQCKGCHKTKQEITENP